MVGMQKNKQTFWYSQLERYEDLLDANGYKVGQKPIYGPIQFERATVSEGVGSPVLTRFGLETPNTRTIGPLDVNCQINEHTKIWIDTPPEPDKDGFATVPNDYVVNNVRGSLNHVMCIVRKAHNGAMT